MYHKDKKCSSYSRFPRVFQERETSPPYVENGKRQT